MARQDRAESPGAAVANSADARAALRTRADAAWDDDRLPANPDPHPAAGDARTAEPHATAADVTARALPAATNPALIDSRIRATPEQSAVAIDLAARPR